MKTDTLILLSLLSMATVACTSTGENLTGTRQANFDQGWTFHWGDEPEAADPDYDDSGWRQLTLPHDWAIEGSFNPENPSGTGGGALPGGIGWYRKTFFVEQALADKRLRVDFDGAYMNATVYLNGEELGTRPYGYSSFSYDLTPYIKWGARNVLAVKVDNAEQPNSRWYSGCGIYRHVWLTTLNPLHVAHWGTYVTADEVSTERALLTVRTTLQNESETGDAQAVALLSQLLDAEGKVVSELVSDLELAAASEEEVRQEIRVESPTLWDVENPYLYNIKSTLTDKATGEVLDTYYTPVGIRSFRFDAVQGFILNGKQMKINGVCLHHDLGCLGSAVNTRAIERQLEILKEMGCNGIRCSHNPPAPELLDLCDRMGFIVMDEAFDMWRKRKTPYDYARYFNEWHERDLTDLLLRDRNHPSVFMWSIGNEVLEQWSDAKADTLSLEEANLLLNFGHDATMLAEEGNMSVNSLLTKKLADIVKAVEPTRPVVAACNEVNPGNHLFRSGALDIIGFNYHHEYFEGVPKNFPGKPFIVTESVSGLMTRGYYRMPGDSMYIFPDRWDKPFYDDSFACSSYDNCHVPWGSSHEETLRYVKRNDFISGQYIWTGFDYIGEPTPYGWPARSSYFGIVDLAGFPKDVYYMYQSEWRPDKQVLHLYPHWNWTPGETVDLWAYYNNADEVELFVNGESQGVRVKGEDDFHVMWRVTYEPGTVKAVARKNGEVVAEQEIHTAGEPALIRLTPDRTVIHADGSDLSFITVEVTDKEGNLCPNAENDIAFTVQGAGTIAGVDNGSPVSMELFKDDHRKAFYGKCLLVVRNNGEAGAITVTAQSEGLAESQSGLQAEEAPKAAPLRSF